MAETSSVDDESSTRGRILAATAEVLGANGRTGDDFLAQLRPATGLRHPY